MGITRETIERTLDSYREGVAPFFEIAEHLRKDGGGGGIQLYLPTAFEAHAPHALDRATAVACRRESLKDFGRPKIIGENSWAWRSSFFVVTAYVGSRFEYFHYEPAAYSEDGERFEPTVEASPMGLGLKILERSWGIKDWHAKAGDIRSLMDAAPEEVRVDYVRNVREADRAVSEWESEIAKLREMRIPTTTVP